MRWSLDQFAEPAVAPLSPPANRKWLDANGKIVMPDLAVMFRFNCRLADDQIAGLLPQSGVGNNRVYLAPYPADKWQIVWLQSGHAEALQQAAKCRQQCGLVRNRTGYGLRVLVGEFAKVYKQVFPSREVPRTVKGLWRNSSLCQGSRCRSCRIGWMAKGGQRGP